MTMQVQRRNVRIAAAAIASPAAGHSIVGVHVNGPQVGLLSLQAEAYKGAASKLTAEKGWAFRQDWSAWRRVVPSPEPAHPGDPAGYLAAGAGSRSHLHGRQGHPDREPVVSSRRSDGRRGISPVGL